MRRKRVFVEVDWRESKDQPRLIEHVIHLPACRLQITTHPKNKCVGRRKVPQIPCSVSEFTIGQWCHILAIVQQQPYKETPHLFVFGKQSYLVKVVKDEAIQEE